MRIEQSSRRARARRGVIHPAAGLAAALPLAIGAPGAHAETRGYLVSWFAIATNNPDFTTNCPEAAKDPKRVQLGVDDAEERFYRYKASVNGKPVSPFNYPSAVDKDPNIETVVGPRAYGFDLGGPESNKFTDPETHEKVDNQLWRAVGCLATFQATPPVLPYSETAPWGTMIDTAPGYAIQITGADLSKDGPVTVTLDRTLRHPERDATGGVRSFVSYVIDPSPRSHNELAGEIKNGMLQVKSDYVYLVGSMPFYTQLDLKNAHIRMRSEPGGKVTGYWGGYTDWHAWIYTYTARPASGADSIGLYWAFEKLADAGPDPVTGKNQLISMTWRFEAVPAFFATNKDGRTVAVATSEPLGGTHNPAVAQATGAVK